MRKDFPNKFKNEVNFTIVFSVALKL